MVSIERQLYLAMVPRFAFVAGAFPGYFYLASTPGDTFPHLTDPRQRLAGTISVRGGTDYECVKHGWSEVKII